MKFGKRPHGGMRQLVRIRSTPYDLERPSGSQVGAMGERSTANTDSTTTITGVNLWLFDPDTANVDTSFGDRLEGDLRGLALDGADVQYDDRVTHGSHEYEVERVTHVPDDNNPVLKVFSLVRRTNT